ncbi:MAG: heavy-metal-associated domain-containing protein [Halobacteriota archaeon]
MSVTLSVSGMSCTGCESNVEDAVSALEGVSKVDADNEAGTVTVDGSFRESSVREAIETAGYTVE